MEDSDPLEVILVQDSFYGASPKKNSEANLCVHGILFQIGLSLLYLAEYMDQFYGWS